MSPSLPFSVFKRKPQGATGWRVRWTEVGISISSSAGGEEAFIASQELTGFVTQLSDDGHLVSTDHEVVLGWDAFYDALGSAAYEELPEALRLPRPTSLQIALKSNDSLTDSTFGISVGWRDETGTAVFPTLTGAVLSFGGRSQVMQRAQWPLFSAVQSFARRPNEERIEILQRQSWGRIRQLGQLASAHVDDFLYRSVVLTPDRLEIGLRRSEVVTDDHVIEIEPQFLGAPPNWLEEFDRHRSVKERYDLVTPEGIVQVLVTAKVRTVLEEIRRLPGRRVAGARAQAFIVNPFATLGDDAKDVIVESQFEQARESAGLRYERFTPVLDREPSGGMRAGLLVETASASGVTSAETIWLDDLGLVDFISKIETATSRDHQLIAWRGYDLEVQGDIHTHLATLRSVLAKPTADPVVSYAQVHDLEAYSTRIEGIGIEKPYYSPYIAKKKDDEGWFPDNVIPVIVHTPEGETEPIAVPIDHRALSELQGAVTRARTVGEADVNVDWLPKPIALKEAEHIGVRSVRPSRTSGTERLHLASAILRGACVRNG